MQTIVVGYDETEGSKRALERAAEIAGAFGGRLIVTSVAPVQYYATRSRGPVGPGETLLDHRDMLAEARTTLEGKGVEADYVWAAGEPGDTIVQIADEQNADLIVVGTREPGLLERLIGGSVSQDVAREAECDVLVVH
jgi:nucleotide-binding universal stress UspA family protein